MNSKLIFCKIRIPLLLGLSTIILSLTGCLSSKLELKLTNDSGNYEKDKEPVVYKPVYNEAASFGNEYVEIDASNSSEGYFTVISKSNAPRVKLLLSVDDDCTYIYNLTKDKKCVVPFSLGSGKYNISVHEEIINSQYALCYETELDVNLNNEFGPFLYPNEYVNFNENSEVVKRAKELTANSRSELEEVFDIYKYVVENFTYDEYKAENAPKTYIPSVDDVLSEKKGICLDYSAMTAAMLRSRNIPTRLEIGYAGNEYHAWISVYTKDRGFITDLIEFDGTTWTLMDPTFASSNTFKGEADKIHNGTKYTVMYCY